jgi:hypothetical protein
MKVNIMFSQEQTFTASTLIQSVMLETEKAHRIDKLTYSI